MKATPTWGRGAGRPIRVPRDSFAQYLQEIGGHPLLSQEEEMSLARRIRAGDRAALDRLVACNLRFVVAVAKRYRRFGVPVQDLVTEGNLGLIRAAERFDERRLVRFTSYAVWWIRQSMLEGIRQHSALVRVPVRRSREPAGGGPAGRGRERAIDPPIRYLSLDSRVGPGEGILLGELVSREPNADPGAQVDRAALRDVLEASMTLLDEREAGVLRMCFGLGDEAPRSLSDVSARLGVSRERVRRIRERALARIRGGALRRDLKSFLG